MVAGVVSGVPTRSRKMKKAGVPINKSFVRHQMAQLEMTGQEVAALTGLSQTTVYRVLFKGGPWTDSTLGTLARALQCSPHDLISTKEYPTPLVDAPTNPVGA